MHKRRTEGATHTLSPPSRNVRGIDVGPVPRDARDGVVVVRDGDEVARRPGVGALSPPECDEAFRVDNVLVGGMEESVSGEWESGVRKGVRYSAA